MKNQFVIAPRATLLVSLSVGVSASAGIPNMNGSDTMELVTRDILTACNIPAAAITYVGGGSGTGEAEMLAGKQQVAPMSRFFGTAACSANPNGEGFIIAKDAISIIAAEGNSANGGGARLETGPALSLTNLNGVAGIQCGGGGCTNPTSYAFSDWKDVLRVLFTGMHQKDGNVLANQNCNSDVRQVLVSKYANLFQTPDGVNQTEVLRHAFRRDDLSGTTDTFLNLLGLPGLTQPPNTLPLQMPAGPTPFCNGYDFEDVDPIRRPCDVNEEVCGADGKLGVVLPVTVPTEANTGAGVNPYNNTACTAGVFKWMPAPKRWTAFAGPTPGPNKRLCPNGNPITFAKCLAPVTRTGTTPATFVFTAGCLNPASNKGAPPVADGRVYNLTPRKADGALFTTSRPTPLGPPTGNYTHFEAGFYRIHSTKSFTPGTTCTLNDSTEQIGCLTVASPFSVGFAGREATAVLGAVGLIINNVDGSDDGEVITGLYPLSRKLFLNVLKGIGNVVDGAGLELKLARCFVGDSAVISGGFGAVRAIVERHGFVAIPNPTCESCVGGVACGDNLAPFPQEQCSPPPANPFSCGAANVGDPCLGAVGTCRKTGQDSFGALCECKP